MTLELSLPPLKLSLPCSPSSTPPVAHPPEQTQESLADAVHTVHCRKARIRKFGLRRSPSNDPHWRSHQSNTESCSHCNTLSTAALGGPRTHSLSLSPPKRSYLPCPAAATASQCTSVSLFDGPYPTPHPLRPQCFPMALCCARSCSSARSLTPSRSAKPGMMTLPVAFSIALFTATATINEPAARERNTAQFAVLS